MESCRPNCYTLEINTGRPYTKEGQIILCKINSDGNVHFNDTTRRISGVIEFDEGIDGPLDAAFIMRAYDANCYIED
tara:strand:+ start:356 stop:586 length:231 start_codon:yes stop_codon:yes gene_type:complete